jgi:hypothetical protein
MLIDTSEGDAVAAMAIPTTGTDAYDCSIDWGDDVITTHSGTTPTISHNYASGGQYTISIKGTFPRIYFNNVGDCLKLTSVVNWGKYGEGITDQTSAFYGCTNNTSIAEDWDLIDASITNGYLMFASNALTTLPSGMTLASLDDGTQMFRANTLTSLPSGITLSLLTNGTSMFLNSTINTTDYSAFIVRMEEANSNTGVPFHGGSSTYTGATAIAAHAALLARDPAWTITDGGEV